MEAVSGALRLEGGGEDGAAVGIKQLDELTRATEALGCAHSISTCCIRAAGCCRTFLRLACSIVSMTELS
jgi:hypothetical protein